MTPSPRSPSTRAGARRGGARRRPAQRAKPSSAATLAVALMLGGALSVGMSGLAAGSDPSTLEGRLSAAQAQEGELHAGIGADRRQIAGFQGRIEDLRARLNALQTTLAIERRLLASLKGQLHSARIRLVALRAQLARYRQVLVAQVVAAYEQPPPDIATVILEANGFADLLERLDSLHAISRTNALATKSVSDAKQAVAGQEAKLAALEASRARETRAVLVQRNEVAQLHLALVDRQLQFIRARDRKSAELASLHSHKASLEHELSVLQARELATAGAPAEYGATGYSPAPEGAFGFFPAAGTNYSVGEEPAIAARLNALGKALHLHLIGISGYRSPQHSVEVGGFANDPHTRGEASDTPGIEGVSEATLNRFGLTRPFPGAAEADHIQLAGSA